MSLTLLKPELLLIKLLGLIFFGVMIIAQASAQQLDFNKIAAADEAELSKAMPGLAKQVIENYKEEDRETYLNSLFRLQMIAGNYTEANATIKSLREIPKANDPVYGRATNLQYEIFSNAKLIQAAANVSFEEAFKQSFREAFAKLDDKTAFRISGAFTYDLTRGQNELQKLLDPLKGKKSIELKDALALAQTYQPYQVYKSILPLTQSLLLEEDNRRYIILEFYQFKQLSIAANRLFL